MDPLLLDPGTYAGTYKLVGGRVSLDFVNTVSWDGTPKAHDWLDRATNVTAWAVAVGLIDDGERRALDRRGASAHELGTVHTIRRELRAVLAPLAHHTEPPAASVAAFNARLRAAATARTADIAGRRWTWARPGTLVELLAPVVSDAAEVAIEADRSRLGSCAACDWLFLDMTRNRSRRWCDMQDCGSRDKALRYYHRSRQARPPRR